MIIMVAIDGIFHQLEFEIIERFKFNTTMSTYMYIIHRT